MNQQLLSRQFKSLLLFQKKYDINLSLIEYRRKCLEFEDYFKEYIANKHQIDSKYLLTLMKQMNAERIGSSEIMSQALTILNNYPQNIRQQQFLYALAAKLNLCKQIPNTLNLQHLNSQNFHSQVLLYFSLTEDDRLIQFCQQLPTKTIEVYYYLQYMLHGQYKIQPKQLRHSEAQIRYREQIKEPYEEEKQIGLYNVDFYLPQSNTIIEINGYHHYHNFGERRIGQYQIKYNYLKKHYDVKEVRQF